MNNMYYTLKKEFIWLNTKTQLIIKEDGNKYNYNILSKYTELVLVALVFGVVLALFPNLLAKEESDKYLVIGIIAFFISSLFFIEVIGKTENYSIKRKRINFFIIFASSSVYFWCIYPIDSNTLFVFYALFVFLIGYFYFMVLDLKSFILGKLYYYLACFCLLIIAFVIFHFFEALIAGTVDISWTHKSVLLSLLVFSWLYRLFLMIYMSNEIAQQYRDPIIGDVPAIKSDELDDNRF